MKYFRHRLKHFLGESVFLTHVFMRMLLGKNRWLLFTSRTQLVIEGFPRSANTFAVVFFEKAQTKKIRIAHHLHVESQLIWAAKNDIPAIVLIRKPEDCIRSLLVREKSMNLKNALERYITFYTNLLPYKKSLIIAEFSKVTSDMCSVIEQCNKKYMTDFQLEEHTPEYVTSVYNEIDNINNESDKGKKTHVARPEPSRYNGSKAVQFHLFKDKLDQANLVYRSFVSHNTVS